MNNNEAIADRIEEVLRDMFAHFGQYDLGITEYSLFYNPAKHAAWFIVVFFREKDKLRDALTTGGCYHIHTFLNGEFDKVDDVSGFPRVISFEAGNRPMEKVDIEKLIERIVNRQHAQKGVPGEVNSNECNFCGHDFENHELLCSLDDQNETPTKGWIIRPEPECTCFHTWSANYSAAHSW